MTQIDPMGSLVVRLDRMLANLTAHIEQRAAEIAQPLIAKAREAALTDIERARHEQQRAEDLTTELRRQITALQRTVERYQQRASAADTAISQLEERAALAEQRGGQHADAVARVRQLHSESPHTPDLCCCANPYPCPTIRALDPQEANRG